MNHAWCHDPARDAAVRAAEDGRTGPLPTLGECIDGMFPKSGSASSGVEHENKGVSMTKSDRQAADYRAEAIARPFAEAAERSSTVSKTGEGQSGLRTERVTLEFELERGSPPSEWPWIYILSRSDALKMRPGESVRVVEDDRPSVMDEDGDRIEMSWSELANQLKEERDKARKACDNMLALANAHGDSVKSITAERDAAIRERDEARQVAQTFESLCLGEQARNKVLRARVAELESQSESVADRAATAETALAEIKSLDYTRAALNGAAWRAHNIADQALAPTAAETVLKARTSTPGEGSCAAQAASGGGDQPRGWLTEEEREIIAGIADDDEYTEEGQNIAKALLARSSPPEVDLPISLSPIDEELVRKAIAAAGVAVKEVTRG
jgi:hypothetical protein